MGDRHWTRAFWSFSYFTKPASVFLTPFLAGWVPRNRLLAIPHTIVPGVRHPLLKHIPCEHMPRAYVHVLESCLRCVSSLLVAVCSLLKPARPSADPEDRPGVDWVLKELSALREAEEERVEQQLTKGMPPRERERLRGHSQTLQELRAMVKEQGMMLLEMAVRQKAEEQESWRSVFNAPPTTVRARPIQLGEARQHLQSGAGPSSSSGMEPSFGTLQPAREYARFGLMTQSVNTALSDRVGKEEQHQRMEELEKEPPQVVSSLRFLLAFVALQNIAAQMNMKSQKAHARRALKATRNNLEQAGEKMLLATVSGVLKPL